MLKYSTFLLALFAMLYVPAASAQVDSIEVYVIDSYVTPEEPNTFILSFFTSEPAKSKIIIDEEYEFAISDDFTDDHRFNLDITKYQFEDEVVNYMIYLEDPAGNTNQSEEQFIVLPYEIKVEAESNFLYLCLFAGTVFALPSPVYVLANNESYFGLTKEIPILSIRSGKFTYPLGYFSLEYSYIFKTEVNNYLRAGYKHIIEIPGIEYLAPGVNGFTNFKGFNGISPELSVGWVQLFNTFTLYSRYRFNVKPGDNSSEFHEFTIGLYSSFFSFYF
jgi:hypothetical protein